MNPLIQTLLEQAARMQSVILLGRQKRNQAKEKTKFPSNLTVIHEDQALLDEIKRLEHYLQQS